MFPTANFCSHAVSALTLLAPFYLGCEIVLTAISIRRTKHNATPINDGSATRGCSEGVSQVGAQPESARPEFVHRSAKAHSQARNSDGCRIEER